MASNYNPEEAESRWQKHWEENRIYAFDPKDKEREIFSVDTPPPTVSGSMHLGHSFSYSQQDFIVRYKRMKGYNVFYPFGTDDNGLATERLVERLNKVRSVNMRRDEFIKLCLETLERIRPEFVQDWKNIGISCDFSIFYSTINDHCRRLSQRSFIDLYKMGREYRKEAPSMWCPECQTAIAQVELEDKELPSTFNDIIFMVGGEKLTVATTRPELLASCVAVFFHPDDKRYMKYAGKNAIVPVFGHEVPILPDERANPEKGTGLVMCCTFGDQTDIEWYKAHKLPLRISITKDGKMADPAGKYAGLKIAAARAAIIEDMKLQKLLTEQRPIKHAVNVHERCGTPIEIMNTKQWFISYLDLKDQFLESGAKMKWHPEHMRTRLDHWIYGLQWDWCISRQRHFGVPFPVWYCEKCDEVILADEKQLPVDPMDSAPHVKACPKCGGAKFIPEKDVLDTWATSSLSPELAVELMKDSPLYDQLFPMDLRPQAHDIITFWLFNTMVKSLLHHGVNPWENIMISGFALDPHGKKMSKSKGNAIAPQEMIKKYSADALRFWAAGSKLGEDLPFMEKDLQTGKKTATKLWNASRFALMHLEGFKYKKHELEVMDKWMLSKLQKVIKRCTEAFDAYEYSRAKAEADVFFWNVFCDNYLEVVKDRLYNPGNYHLGAKESAQLVLYESTLAILKLFAPILPYITEEIYHLHFAGVEGKKSIHISDWPTYSEELVDEEAENAGDHAIDIISAIRKHKSEKQLSLKAELASVTIGCDDHTRKLVELVLKDIQTIGNVKDIEFGDGENRVNEEITITIS